jgi:hypothetical protein
MDDLTYTLRQLCLRNRDGSFATQADRQRSLALMRISCAKPVFARCARPRSRASTSMCCCNAGKPKDLSTGTLKNRLAHLRWWAEKVGKAGILPKDNTKLGITERHAVAKENKAKELGDRLDGITDAHVRMSLRLQAAFGLRREESIKFRPSVADQGDHIAIQGSWAKGGRDRTIPITMPGQRAVLDETRQLAGFGSLIPANKTYIQQRQVYDGQCKRAGLSNMHGLRHRYAQIRYETLTGWKAPKAGGPRVSQLDLAQRQKDRLARQQISRELGHERLAVTSVYLGS